MASSTPSARPCVVGDGEQLVVRSLARDRARYPSAANYTLDVGAAGIVAGCLAVERAWVAPQPALPPDGAVRAVSALTLSVEGARAPLVIRDAASGADVAFALPRTTFEVRAAAPLPGERGLVITTRAGEEHGLVPGDAVALAGRACGLFRVERTGTLPTQAVLRPAAGMSMPDVDAFAGPLWALTLPSPTGEAHAALPAARVAAYAVLPLRLAGPALPPPPRPGGAAVCDELSFALRPGMVLRGVGASAFEAEVAASAPARLARRGVARVPVRVHAGAWPDVGAELAVELAGAGTAACPGGEEARVALAGEPAPLRGVCAPRVRWDSATATFAEEEQSSAAFIAGFTANYGAAATSAELRLPPGRALRDPGDVELALLNAAGFVRFAAPGERMLLRVLAGAKENGACVAVDLPGDGRALLGPQLLACLLRDALGAGWRVTAHSAEGAVRIAWIGDEHGVLDVRGGAGQWEVVTEGPRVVRLQITPGGGAVRPLVPGAAAGLVPAAVAGEDEHCTVQVAAAAPDAGPLLEVVVATGVAHLIAPGGAAPLLVLIGPEDGAAPPCTCSLEAGAGAGAGAGAPSFPAALGAFAGFFDGGGAAAALPAATLSPDPRATAAATLLPEPLAVRITGSVDAAAGVHVVGGCVRASAVLMARRERDVDSVDVVAAAPPACAPAAVGRIRELCVQIFDDAGRLHPAAAEHILVLRAVV